MAQESGTASQYPLCAVLGTNILPVLGTVFNIATGLTLIFTPHQQLPICGTLLCLFTLLPWWPYALVDLSELRIERFFLACFGVGSCFEYDGIVTSPEFEFLVSVLGALPKLAVMVAGAIEGHDLLFSGRDTLISDWLILICVLLNGAVIAPAAARVYGAAMGPRRETRRATLWAYVVYAADMLALVSVVGTLGVLWQHQRFVEWLIMQWILCGLWPAIAAPLPMPTLQPAVPAKGAQWFAHRMLVSVIGVATVPPLDYVYALPSSQRWVWPFAAIVRTLAIVVTIPIEGIRSYQRQEEIIGHHIKSSGTHTGHHTITLWLSTKDWVVFAAVLIMAGHTLIRSIGLLLWYTEGDENEKATPAESKALKVTEDLQYGAA